MTVPFDRDAHRKALLEAALAYAAIGWHVLPLNGKRPRTKNGLKDATTDAAKIRRWWAKWPDANVGIACALSGLVVLDIDPRNGGEETIAAFEERYGPLPETAEVRTGGGGRHLYYRALQGNPRYPGKLGPGIDIKHDGYVVAPPSIHPDTDEPYD